MSAHLRANVWLLVFTLIICSGLYPLSLLLVGQTIFPRQANGSLIYDANKKAVGSSLIAQQFNSDEYFQSRPSSASYNAMASGASNWGGNNYKLRDRVARSLGSVAKYRTGMKKGESVAEDIVRWFREEKPGVVANWAKAHSGLATAWVSSEDAAKSFVTAWFEKHPDLLQSWKKENPTTPEPKPEDLAGPFFESFSRENPGTWLKVVENKDAKGESVKSIELVKKNDMDSADIASVFFDSWRQEHPNADLEDVPADLVMASASGLDPHITLANATYQLDRVVGKWAEATKKPKEEIRSEVEKILQAKKFAPLSGMAGVDMVNVLEVNLALKQSLQSR